MKKKDIDYALNSLESVERSTRQIEAIVELQATILVAISKKIELSFKEAGDLKKLVDDAGKAARLNVNGRSAERLCDEYLAQ